MAIEIILVLLGIVLLVWAGDTLVKLARRSMAFNEYPHLKYYIDLLSAPPKSFTGGGYGDITYSAKNKRVVFFKYERKIVKEVFTVTSLNISIIDTRNNSRDAVFNGFGNLPPILKTYVSAKIQHLADNAEGMRKEKTIKKNAALAKAIENGQHYKLLSEVNAAAYTEDCVKYADYASTLVVFGDKGYSLYCLREDNNGGGYSSTVGEAQSQPQSM